MIELTADQVRRLQATLARAGFNPGDIDGIFGASSIAALLCFVVGRQLGALGTLLARAMAADFKRYGIVTVLRICHFIAQGAHETGGFRSFVEKGSGDGPDADPWDDYLERYDFRKDLGNSHGGDGERWRGRGIFELTGHANYVDYAKRLGLDLVQHPELAAEPDVSVLIACVYWSDHKLNPVADNDNCIAVTKAINGGTNGLAERQGYLSRAKQAWGLAA